MKRNWMLLIGCLLWAINVNALIVNVQGEGDIEEQGMELSVTDATEDPLTGDMRFEIKGTLLASGPLTVTITRSSTGLEDEFCCADLCQAGNKELTETRHYNPSGIVSWFIHYTPQSSNQETMTYRFEDGTDTLEMIVHFSPISFDIETVGTAPSTDVKKVLKDGIIYIIHHDKKYTL